MKTKEKLKESQLRLLVRGEIRRLLEQGGEEEQEVEQSREELLDKVTHAYARMLKNSMQSVTTEELADSFTSVANAFGFGKDMKMELIRNMRSKIEL